MKKPDKIYLNKLMIRPGMLHPAQFPPDETEEVYIRKGALLEWLESKIYEHNEDKFDDGFNTAIGQVIDKINSL